MFEYFLNKQVTVFRKDGNILQGCILEIKDGFVRMIEPNNKMIAFNDDCIDLIREGIFLIEEKPQQEQSFVIPKAKVVSKINESSEFIDEEEDYEERSYASFNDDFAMKMSTSIDNSACKTPIFLRTTKSEE